jgi:hypothetical protein
VEIACVGEIRNAYRTLIGKLQRRELLGDIDGMML